MNIAPTGGRKIRIPQNYDFSLVLQEQPVTLAAPSQSEVTANDVRLLRSSSATVRFDASLGVAPFLSAPEIRFSSGNTNRATVGENGAVTTTGTGPVDIFARTKWLSKKVTHIARTEGPVVHDEFLYFVAGSLGAHVNGAVDAAISEGGTLPLFSMKNHAASSYTRNSSCWMSEYNFTGVSPWNSTGANTRGGTLVSPRHAIWADHYNIANGATLRFVAGNGSVTSRTVANSVRVGASDIRVGVLDSDVPEAIAFYKVLPANWRDFLFTLSPARTGIIALDQEQKVLCRDLAGGSATSLFHQSATGARAAFTETLISGDSGQPNFMAINNELILLGCHHGAGAFPHIAGHFSEVNSAMTILGGGYQLTEVDLSEFPNYANN
jgi:hypothetical protein